MEKDKKEPLFGLAQPVPAEEVFYARVSDKDDQSPDMQIAMAEKRGIPPNNIFVDLASGRSMSRPRLKAALMLMEGRPGWTLVVYKLDRLGRDAIGLMQLAKEFEEKGWNLVSLSDQIDTRTAMGRAFFGFMAVIAQLESDLISERTRAGMARRKERGFKLGRKSALSYKQWLKVEDDLLNRKDMTIAAVAEKHKIHASSVQNHFPRWRSKTQKERDAHRAKHPLPGQQ